MKNILKKLPKRPDQQNLQVLINKGLFERIKAVKEPYSWTEIIEACLEAYLEEKQNGKR